jgi:cobalt/nickel transport system permease protein
VHASAFDRYHAGTSVIHGLDPRVKVLATVAFIASNSLLPDGAVGAFAAAEVAVLAVTILAGLPVAFAVRRSLIALPFMLAALSIIFTLPGTPVFHLAIGPWTLVATDAGLARFASIMARSLLSVQMAILLVATTPFPDIIHALGHLRVPAQLVAVLSYMYRYLFVLADEAMRLMRAREARSATEPGRSAGGSLRWRARVAGHMVGQLFMRSYERGDRVYNAMLARGYRGVLYTPNPHQMRRLDWLAGLAAGMAVVALQVGARLP